MKRLTRVMLLGLILSRTVAAQHASDDPVASAGDGFGLTLGLESIGIYGPGSVRGFSAQTAGNVRIDGLYFDQQGTLSNRVVEGSTIRVGVSEIGYAFPAPTGIVDYDLRHAPSDTLSGTLVMLAGPFEARGGSIDANVPVPGTGLRVPMGASYQISTNTLIGSPNPGYTENVFNAGAAPRWQPSDNVVVRGIVDWQQISQARTLPLIFTAGDYLPPETPRGYYGQNWATSRYLSETFGGLVTAQLSKRWSLEAGLFRSIANFPIYYTDLYLNTRPNGAAEQQIVASPQQITASTSGEGRLTGHFGSGAWRESLVLNVRGRDTLAQYGGSDSVDVGPALIYQNLQVPEPEFQYSARTEDHTELWSAGVALRVQWQGHADITAGLQRESYDKHVAVPGLPATALTDHPLRAYTGAALVINDQLSAYSGYTQGLEDSGVAPSGAANRGAILEDARTWQADAGLRLQVTSKVKLIAGVFEITKPYFNFDSENVDRELGLQRAKGIELSLSGEILKNLNVVAGALVGQVRIQGPNLASEGVGPIAFG